MVHRERFAKSSFHRRLFPRDRFDFVDPRGIETFRFRFVGDV